MKYTNPKVDDSVNVGKRHPLKELARVLIAVALLLVVVGGVLVIGVGYFVKFVPFEFESQVANRFSQSTPTPGPERDALQALADRLVPHMDLPSNMQITVHYVDDDVINAFATLGGHVVIFRGLLETLKDENSLAMVMAHEIAHVEYRHPIASLGRGIAVMLSIMAVGGSSGGDVPEGLINGLGVFSTMSFSRAQESEADESAIAALHALYGHIGGSDSFFRVADGLTRGRPPELFSTHPEPARRIDGIARFAEREGWALDGERQALAEVLNKH